MRELSDKKPWYFAFVVISFIASSVLESTVEYYVGEERIQRILGSTIALADILPWIVAVAVLIICLGVYIYQLRQSKKTYINPQLSSQSLISG